MVDINAAVRAATTKPKTHSLWRRVSQQTMMKVWKVFSMWIGSRPSSVPPEAVCFDQGLGDPTDRTHDHRGQRQGDQHVEQRGLAALVHALDGQVPHDEALVHEGERDAARQGLPPEQADGVELRGAGQVHEGQPVRDRQPAPVLAEAAQGGEPGEDRAPPGQVEHEALEQVGEDHRRLPPEGDVGPQENRHHRDGHHHADAEHALQGGADGEEVVADVVEHVGEDDDHRDVPRGAVEPALEVLRDRLDPGEVDDRQPPEHEEGHEEPVIGVRHGTAHARVVPLLGILQVAVGADAGGHHAGGGQPPGEALPAEEEVVDVAAEAREVGAEAGDQDEVADHDHPDDQGGVQVEVDAESLLHQGAPRNGTRRAAQIHRA